jgi:DNA damage-binding protein 1
MGAGRYISSLYLLMHNADTASMQQQIVTCSGGRSKGSLNVVRNGADFRALAVAEGLENVTNIWPIRALFEDT